MIDDRPSHLRTRYDVAVVGAGPAGLSCAITAAQRGHEVVLYEQSDQIGGQFNIARKIPGKEEFNETLRYFHNQVDLQGVKLRLGTQATAEALCTGGFDEIVLATGILPRRPQIEGIDHPSVLTYTDVLLNDKHVGAKVAIIGAGGIGFDTAIFLSHDETESATDRDAFYRTWGIDPLLHHAGGLDPRGPRPHKSPREIFLLQRKGSKMGADLSKTTGWIHRAHLRQKEVTMLNAVTYDRIDDQGLHITRRDKKMVLAVDHIVICAGQRSRRDLVDSLQESGLPVHVIGGAELAAELDAKRAIDEGARIAASL